MRIFAGRIGSGGVLGGCSDLLRAARFTIVATVVLAAVLWTTAAASAQTLARPGWAGSGMKVTQWWHNAVLVEVSPQSAGDQSVLSQTRAQLGDLQTLGADALLLRGISSGEAVLPATVNSHPRRVTAAWTTSTS